jgi:hypothetical protein
MKEKDLFENSDKLCELVERIGEYVIQRRVL